MHNVSGKPNRLYLLFEANSDKGINKDYFSKNAKSFITEIDKIQVKVLFEEDDDGFMGKRKSFVRGEFSQKEAMIKYKQDIQNSKYLFQKFMEKRPNEAIEFFPKRIIGRKKKTYNITTSVSLETILPKDNILKLYEGDSYIYHRL